MTVLKGRGKATVRFGTWQNNYITAKNKPDSIFDLVPFLSLVMLALHLL